MPHLTVVTNAKLDMPPIWGNALTTEYFCTTSQQFQFYPHIFSIEAQGIKTTANDPSQPEKSIPFSANCLFYAIHSQ